MPRAIKIEDLQKIDETSARILRVIALRLGEESEGYVDYTHIARSLTTD